MKKTVCFTTLILLISFIFIGNYKNVYAQIIRDSTINYMTSTSDSLDCFHISPSEIPYIENFDNNNGDFPPCWYKSSNFQHSFITSRHATSPPYSLNFDTWEFRYVSITTPSIDTSLSALMVRFKLRVNTIAPIVVAVTSTPEVIYDFIPIDTVYATKMNTWEEFEVYFDDYNGNADRIVFANYNHRYTEASIDDIVIDYTPSCIKPRDVSAISATTQSITVDWMQGDEVTWEIEVGAPGFSPGTGDGTIHNITNNPPYTISGLSTNILYDIYIRAVCSVNDTSDRAFISIRTSCDAITSLPYYEDFNSYSPLGYSDQSVMPYCWRKSCSRGGDVSPYIGHWGYESDRALDFNFTESGYSLAILPEIDESIPMTSIRIIFDGKKNCSQGSFIVGVMDNPLDDDTFTPVATINGTSSTYRKFTTYLNSYAGSGRYIAFKWMNGDMCSYFLDNLTVETVNCHAPENLTAYNITDYSMNLKWDDVNNGLDSNDDSQSWVVAHKIIYDSIYMINVVSNNSYGNARLLPGTPYEFCVTSNCITASSGTMCVYLTTQGSPPEYTIRATASGHGEINPSGSVLVPLGQNKTFTFEPDTGYIVKSVQINYIEIDPSEYSNNQYTFTHVMIGGDIHVDFQEATSVPVHNLKNSFSIFPNPTKNRLTITSDVLFETVEIFNTVGELIYSAAIHDLNFTIDVSQYHSGIYFIKLSGKQGVEIKKFIRN